MNTPTPIDPDVLRSLLTQAVEPVTPSPDALREIRTGIRQRKLRLSFGTGAGALLITGGAVAAVIALGSAGSPQASSVTLQPGQTTTGTAARTTAPTTTAPTTTAPARTTPPAVPVLTVGPAGSVSAAVVTGVPNLGGPAIVTGSTSATSSAVTSTPVSPPPTAPLVVANDVDGDGTADSATISYAGNGTARLLLHSGAGKVVASAPFSKAGPVKGTTPAVTFADVNGDGRDELMVYAGGASANAYELFQYAGGQLLHVAAAGGWPDPFLVSGGGSHAGLSFGCSQGILVLSKYGPTDILHFVGGPTQTYDFKTARFSVTNGQAHLLSSSSQSKLKQADADALLSAQSANRCGAPL